MSLLEINYPSVQTDLTLGEYHAHPALGSSQIKMAGRSMAHFKALIDGRIEISTGKQNSFDLGTCMHSVALEQTTAPFLCGPGVETRNAKEWKEFVANNPTKKVLKPGEFRRVTEAFDALASHSLASSLISACMTEMSFFYQDSETGLKLKARPDGVSPNKSLMLDYKTTARSAARAEDFARQVLNLGYHISAPHYLEGFEAATDAKISDFYWIVQETTAPYAISIFKASRHMLEAGRIERRTLLNKISVAKRENYYPGYSTDIVEIDLPAWANAHAFEMIEEVA